MGGAIDTDEAGGVMTFLGFTIFGSAFGSTFGSAFGSAVETSVASATCREGRASSETSCGKVIAKGIVVLALSLGSASVTGFSEVLCEKRRALAATVTTQKRTIAIRALLKCFPIYDFLKRLSALSREFLCVLESWKINHDVCHGVDFLSSR
jgi:hypothetical protein